MAEIIQVKLQASKKETYESILLQAQSLFENEEIWSARASNLCSLLHFAFNHHWTGIYLLHDTELVLNNFQGPVACTRIEMGKGVCGKAAADKQTVIVPDVHQFTGHIACSDLTKSEIVVPIFDSDKMLIGVLDIDSMHFNTFDDTDLSYLEKLVEWLSNYPNAKK